jgi:hypothetical protein
MKLKDRWFSFPKLMKRLREIATGPAGFLPVLATPLSG